MSIATSSSRARAQRNAHDDPGIGIGVRYGDKEVAGHLNMSSGSVDGKPIGQVAAGSYVLPVGQDPTTNSTEGFNIIQDRPTYYRLSVPSAEIEATTIKVGTGEALATLSVALYKAEGPDGLQLRRILYVPDIDCSTSGAKKVTFANPVSISAGDIWYAHNAINPGLARWLGVVANSTFMAFLNDVRPAVRQLTTPDPSLAGGLEEFVDLSVGHGEQNPATWLAVSFTTI